MSGNSFAKVYWIRHDFEVEHDSQRKTNTKKLIKKKQIKKTNISRYQTANLLKPWFLILVCKKGNKENKSKFGTKSVGIIVTIIFT